MQPTPRPSHDQPTDAVSLADSRFRREALSGAAMDRTVRRRRITPKRIVVAVVLLLVALGAVWASSAGRGKRLRLDADQVVVSSVEPRPFQEYIALTGTVVPRTTIYLDAIEGGSVQQVLVHEGARVVEGQPLLELANNDLQLRLLAAETQRIEQITRLEDVRFRMEQNTVLLRQQLAKKDYERDRLGRQLRRQEALWKDGLLSDEEYEDLRDQFEYAKKDRELTLTAYQQESERLAKQLDQMRAQVAKINRNQEVVRQVFDHLTVRAPATGRVTALEAEAGEALSKGARLGQIDVLEDGYKVRAPVDELYISRVGTGQAATSQPLGGAERTLELTKVYPEVVDGDFDVDLEFSGETPPAIRRGQTVRLRLALSDPEEVLVLPRGPFYQESGGNSVFVVRGDHAVRVPIRVDGAIRGSWRSSTA